MIACTFYQGYFIHSLSTLYYYSAPSLATRLTGDYRDRTYTGKCGPASLDTRHKKSSKSFSDLLLSLAAGGRLIFSFESSGQGAPKIKKQQYSIY